MDHSKYDIISIASINPCTSDAPSELTLYHHLDDLSTYDPFTSTDIPAGIHYFAPGILFTTTFDSANAHAKPKHPNRTMLKCRVYIAAPFCLDILENSAVAYTVPATCDAVYHVLSHHIDYAIINHAQIIAIEQVITYKCTDPVQPAQQPTPLRDYPPYTLTPPLLQLCNILVQEPPLLEDKQFAIYLIRNLFTAKISPSEFYRNLDHSFTDKTLQHQISNLRINLQQSHISVRD